MAIHSQSVKTGFFIGNGGERTYPFSFKIFNPADVAVYTSNKAGTDEVKLGVKKRQSRHQSRRVYHTY